ncbi:MAG: type II secretion system protein J [bacterium]
MVSKTDIRNHPIPGAARWAFTLVELMVSIAVISILAGLAAQSFRAVMTSREIAMRRLEINETGRSVLDYMATELKSAYLTPDSVKPVTQERNPQPQDVPRFRFVGINRDVVVEPDSGTPGAGVDDDGDGLVDEEVLDGVDGDYANGGKDALRNGRPVPDPLGCEPGDWACIDEDIGLYPSDLLHFVSAVESSGDLILQEISYGLDSSGTKLIRRAQVLDLTGTGPQDRQKLLDFGQFIDTQTRLALVPPPVAAGIPMPRAQVVKAIQNWDTGSKYGWLVSQNVQDNQNPGKLFQVLAYDVRGLRLRYWYYDYNRGGWRVTPEWDSARETALMAPNELLFNLPAANNSVEGNSLVSFANLIVNEPDDAYPRLPGFPLRFLETNPKRLLSGQEYYDVRNRILARTDGLPNMVEITIYVQDQARNMNPRPFTTRVFVPNNYRSIANL